MTETQIIASRPIDYAIDESNGPKSISGMIDTAKRSIDDRTRTVLCTDGSGNEAIVLIDEHDVLRTYQFRQQGVADRAEVAELIGIGIDWRTVVDPGEEVPMIAGARYSMHGAMDFDRWEPGSADTSGYRCDDYFGGDTYLGADCDGVEPVFVRSDR